jgi:hypothetical protein
MLDTSPPKDLGLQDLLPGNNVSYITFGMFLVLISILTNLDSAISGSFPRTQAGKMPVQRHFL